MKTNKFIASCALALFAVVLCPGASSPGDSEETVELKVLKSYSGHDGDAQYRAYAVEWNGQEVIVIDPRGTTDFRSDEPLIVLVVKNMNRGGRGPPGILNFLVSPAKYKSPYFVSSHEGTYTSVEMKVTKVVRAEDGPYVFKSYLGDWNGQEVSINDPLGDSNYAVDDVVTVKVGRIPFTVKGEPHESLMFSVLPSVGKRSLPTPAPRRPGLLVPAPQRPGSLVWPM